VIEKVFQGWAKEIDDKDIMQAFLAKVIDIRDTSCDVLVSGHLDSAVYLRQPTRIL